MELGLEQKVVIITGGTGGIGKQICVDFLLEESIVITLYRTEAKFEALKRFAEEKNCSGEQLFGYQSNLLDPTELKQTVEKILAQFGTIDILVNAAGATKEVPFLLLEQGEYEDILNLNLLAPLHLMHIVLKPMYRQKSGCIINISSVSSHSGGRGIATYSAAKAGLNRVTQTIAIEVGRKNIRVNSICPGVIDTPMAEPLLSRAGDEILNRTALSRIGKPEEVSKAVLFLASEQTASFITGMVMNVDGGFH